jgi:uncharacterized LabA/DUF88 family protein
MNLAEYKKETIREKLGIGNEFGRIFSAIDFGNVDYWFDKDEWDDKGNKIPAGDKLVVSIEKLCIFCSVFSNQKKFYFGLDHRKEKSIHLIRLARENFGKTNAVTKHIQYIKHYLSDAEADSSTRSINYDLNGKYVHIKKCNFDVEICVDAIRLMDKYDTICLFSGDADFARLLGYLKEKGKKVILIRGGFVLAELIRHTDLEISAQKIKSELTVLKSELGSKKQKSRL